MIRCLLLYYALIPLMALSDTLALHHDAPTLLQHLFYPLCHANIVHWSLNGMSLLWLASYLRWPRTMWAYLFSVICGYIYIPDLPLLGCSTIIYFYIGMLFVHLDSWSRWRIIIIGMAGLFIPGIAAITHLIMLAFGILSEILRLRWMRYDLM